MSSEPEILLSKTPEAVNDIPETGTNETTTLGAASTSLDEMPFTEKNLNETLKQLRVLEKNMQISAAAVSELVNKNQALQSNGVFSLSRFTSDEAMLFYTYFIYFIFPFREARWPRG